MRKLILLAAAATMALPAALVAQNADLLKEWPVERGGRTRDPYVAPDGKVWFVGQTGNYVANLDPTTGAVKYVEIEEGTNPHSLIVDPNGIVWYTGNQNGRIGRIDPRSGEIKTFMMPDPAAVRDPHTMVWDGKGNIWFTAQNASRMGRLNVNTGKIDIINPLDRQANPYGIVLDSKGTPWANLFRTNLIASIDPNTLAVKTYPLANEATRNRRIAITADDMLWYTDYARGYIGRLNPTTGEVKEWLMPGGATSAPYAIVADDQGRLWATETGPAKRLVGFDPKTEKFFSNHTVSGNIRHMMFDARTGSMWFGTDANQVGRLVTRSIIP